MLKQRLFTPGPVPVPDRVRAAMAQPILHHRQANFIPVFARCRKGLQQVFQTERPVLILASTGTGAMEAAVCNTLSPGDHAVVVRGGKFGERWAEICDSRCIRTTCIDVPWGQAVDPAEVERVFDANPDARALLVQASETSTGARHPVQALAEITHRRDDRLLIVDAITAVGVYDVPMDAWDLDVVVGGAQKAFMLPPGLAFIALSERAERAMADATSPRFYFDLAKELKVQPTDQTAWTSPVSLLVGLGVALDIMVDEIGLQETFVRTERIAHATRESLRAIGLELYAPDAPSPALTAVKVPEGIEGPKLRATLRDSYGLMVADGQGAAKGKIIRIAHLGYFDRFDALTAIAAVEMALADLGYQAKLGEAARTATELLRA